MVKVLEANASFRARRSVGRYLRFKTNTVYFLFGCLLAFAALILFKVSTAHADTVSILSDSVSSTYRTDQLGRKEVAWREIAVSTDSVKRLHLAESEILEFSFFPFASSNKARVRFELGSSEERLSVRTRIGKTNDLRESAIIVSGFGRTVVDFCLMLTRQHCYSFSVDEMGNDNQLTRLSLLKDDKLHANDSTPDYRAIARKLSKRPEQGESHSMSSDTLLDILFVYTDSAVAEASSEEFLKLKVFGWVARANVVLANSSIAIHERFRVVGFHRIPDVGIDIVNSSLALERLTYQDGVADSIFPKRDELGADFVATLVSELEGNVGGRAWLWSDINQDFSAKAFSIMTVNGDTLTLAHELGHNLGLAHNIEIAEGTGMFQESHGLNGIFAYCGGVEDGCPAYWRTVMSYTVDPEPSWFSSEPRINTFSTPLNHVDGYAAGNHSTAFNASTVQQTAPIAVNWRPQVIPPPSFPGTVMLSASDNFPLWISVAWQEMPEAEYYLLYRSTYPWANCHDSTFIRVTSTPDASLAAPEPGSYYFQVRAIVNGQISECSTNYVEGIALDGLPPVVDFEASDGEFESGVRLSWIPYGNSSDKVRIYRNQNPSQQGCFGAEIDEIRASEGEFFDSSVAVSEVYYYSARSYDVHLGLGPCTEIDPGWAAEFLAPSNVSASDGLDLSGVEVTWQVSANPVDGYKIYRTPDASSPEGCELDDSVYVFTVAGGDSNFFFDDTLPFPGVEYSYSMRSYRVGAGGQEELSPNCSNIDQGYFSGIVPPPFIIASNGAFQDVFVTWLTIQAAIGYELYRNATCSGTPIAVLPYWQTNFWDDGLNYPQTSFYAVRSIGVNGPSACSTPDEGWPAAPVSGARPPK